MKNLIENGTIFFGYKMMEKALPSEPITGKVSDHFQLLSEEIDLNLNSKSQGQNISRTSSFIKEFERVYKKNDETLKQFF